MIKVRTLLDIIEARKLSKNKGIIFIKEKQDEFVSYKELYDNACKILGYFQNKGIKKQEEVILQLEDNKEFVFAFWACILGGIIPVPIAIGTTNETKLKLFKVYKTLKKPHVITFPENFIKLKKFAEEKNLKQDIKNIKTNTIFFDEFEKFESKGKVQQIKPTEIAFIQFSSGSTGYPKGVILTHENLITNLNSIVKAAVMTKKDSCLSWMPLTHDMGLIGYHLVPAIVGINQAIMPTTLFIRRPMLWMTKANEYRLTVTCSPNFGYKHFLTFFNTKILKDIDLSCIRLMLNGAEPISKALCNDFLDKLDKYGLKRKAMLPVYGLAEASLAVSFTPIDEEIKSISVDRTQIGMGNKIKYLSKNKKNEITFVDVGYALENIEINILDNKNNALPENTIGNIFIRGKNVTKGYYRNPNATKRTITKDGWLNTGDLGFIRNKRLIVTGRAKDILFVNGQNYYSHDIERVAEKTGNIELGKVAVVSAYNNEIQGDEIILFVLFKKKDLKDFIPFIKKLKRDMNREMNIEIKEVLPITKIPKTTSGKIQRYILQKQYMQGVYNEKRREIERLMKNIEGEKETYNENKKEEIIDIIKKDLIKEVSKILNVEEAEINDEATLNEYGFNSLTLTQLAAIINKKYNITITPDIFFEYGTINDFVEYFSKEYNKEIIGHYKIIGQVIEYDKEKKFGKDTITPGLGCKEEPIAIIGMGGIMPGAENLEAFWSNLESGKNCISEIPKERWDWEKYYGDPTEEMYKTNIKWGGFIKEVDKFDPMFFGMSPREAELMDPQQRIFLETVWQTIENAGYKVKDFSGTKTGIFAGVSSTDYNELLRENTVAIETHTATGIAHSILANRVSYLLNLRGPSKAIDTACSSSLIALTEAVDAIRNGKCEMALAGGINLILTPSLYISFSKAGMLSEDGKCKTFDKQADGYTRGEGVGVILLKPFSKAVSDGDYIYGLIRAATENHGGHTNSLTAPNPKTQAELLVNAYRKAGISPDKVSYIEAHGTGTALGDPIEAKGLKKAFEELFKLEDKKINKGYCGLGSVKTNIGHLEAAAGIAGVLKVLLAMKYKKLPGNVHFKELNPYIKLEETPFYIVDKTKEWKSETPRIAGVSAFGFGGANAHVVIEEYSKKEILDEKSQTINMENIFVLSAKNEERLKEYAKRIVKYLERDTIKKVDFKNIIYTLQIGRDSMEKRLALLVKDKEELKEKLKRYIGEEKVEKMFTGIIKEKDVAGKYIQDDILVKTAKLWVSGEEIDWNILPQNKGAKRIPVPTYPFAKERYWFRSNVKHNKLTTEKNELAEKPQKNLFFLNKDSNLCEILNNEILYYITIENNILIREHTVFGHYIMPTDSLIEMVYTGAEHYLGYKNLKLDQVFILSPLVSINDKITKTVQSFHNKDQKVEFLVKSQIEGIDKNYKKNVQGFISKHEFEIKKNEHCKKMLNSFQNSIARESFYDDITNPLQVGEFFRSIQMIKINGKEAIGTLKLSDKGKEFYDKFLLHPGILDGLLGIVVALAIKLTGITKDYTFIPIYIDNVIIYKQLTDEFYMVHVKTIKINAEFIRFNVDLIDSKDNIVLSFVGLDEKKISLEDTNNYLNEKKQKVTVLTVNEINKKIILKNKNDINIIEQHSAATNNLSKIKLKHTDVIKENNTGELNPIKNKNDILKTLKHLLSEILLLDENKISEEKNFMEQGMDSILGLEFVQRVNREYDIQLQGTAIYENTTLEKLSEYLMKKEGEKIVYTNQDMNNSDAEKVSITNSKKTEELKPENYIQPITIPYKRKPIAIIGMSGKFPQAKNVDQLWNNLEKGVNSIIEVPRNRWDINKHYDKNPQSPNKTYSKWGGFLSDIDQFDPLFFNISPKEAELMDPQQRLFLEESWMAIANAGYSSEEMNNKRCGVFVGIAGNDYIDLMKEKKITIEPHTVIANAASILVARIAYFLNLKGACLAIDTACSSSLVAVHVACESIISGKTDMALAGGVNILTTPGSHIGFSKAGMLSSSGQCRTFDSFADGFVPSESVGVVILKSLEQALKDKDNIYGIIKGSGMNQNGYSNGIVAPSSEAQSELVEEVYKDAGVNPNDISYIEMNGTGSILGDAIEFVAMKKVFENSANKKNYCALGAIKTNIGHGYASSGVVSLIKVLLSLKHKKLPKILNFKETNKEIDLNNSPFYINTELKAWEREKGVPLRAGINSFGLSGTNCHVVIEEYIQNEIEILKRKDQDQCENIFILSDTNKERLKKYAQKIAKYIDEHKNEILLQDIAYTLQVGRNPLDERIGFTVKNIEELLYKLKSYISGKNLNFIYSGNVNNNENKLGLFEEDEYLREAINKWIEKGRLSKLVELWVNGVEINWNKLPQNESARRISLPIDPFTKKRYWITETKAIDLKKTVSKSQIKFLEDEIKKIICETIKIENDDLSKELELTRYGMDSILAMQFKNILEKKYNIEINIIEFLAWRTIGDIISGVKEKLLIPNKFQNIQEKHRKQVEKTKKLLEKEIDLYVPKLQNRVKKYNPKKKWEKIFLTGATGFLGVHILKELLLNTKTIVYCLVRAKNNKEGKKRILDSMLKYGIDSKFSNRIYPVLGDLSKQHLGIKTKEYNKICKEVDVIYHNGAIVNHIFSYDDLKSINSDSTKSIIKIASSDHIKPIFFTSTIFVAYRDKKNTHKVYTTEKIIADTEGLLNGYAQTKWVSEHFLVKAKECGVPFIIFRPTEITGSMLTGKSQINDAFHYLLKLMLELGGIKEYLNGFIDFLPVDFVSQSIVNISLDTKNFNKVFHLVSAKKMAMKHFLNKICTKEGVNAKLYSIDKWLEMVRSHFNKIDDKLSVRILAEIEFIFQKTPNGYILDMFLNTKVDNNLTLKFFEKKSIKPPNINNYTLWKKYFKYLREVNFLNLPGSDLKN